jgi:hypothetical protein
MNIDTAYNDRQDLINNLPAVPVLAEPHRGADHASALQDGIARESNEAVNNAVYSENTDSRGGRQTLPDTWEAIEAQLDHWAEMDREYWRQRKEKEYAVWLERTYGV